MKTQIAALSLLALFSSVLRAHAQEADATFKAGVAQLYKDWFLSRPFLIAYDVHTHSVVKGKAGEDIHHETRIAVDMATARFIWERHDWPGGGEPATYHYARWNGKEKMDGSSLVPRMLRVAGKPVTTLPEAPVGIPLCPSVLVTEVPDTAFVILNRMPEMMAAGFALDEKTAPESLQKMLKDPKARLEHLPGTGPEELTLTLLDKRIVFDARLGLIKETQGFGGSHMRRVVHRFQDRMPVEISMIEDYAQEQAQNIIEFKAIPGQCRALSAQEFEDLIHLEFPPDILVSKVRRRPLIVVPANGK